MRRSYKLVSIEWMDSKGVTQGWERLDEIKPLLPCKCKSVGFLIDDKEDYKTLVQTISKDWALGRITIPSCSILKIEKIN